MIQSLNALPLHSIILTDIATDGMMAGPNLEHLAQCISISQHPIILSGGVHNAEAVIQAKQIGAAGCIIGKALLSGALSLNEIYAILNPSC
jgi:phosphoribosylformimino-5-aminoimidazole carboxamide ribotide isomerase